ncbi:hypothetical protein GCM10022294_03310 [Dietzia aurantiaca]
MRMVVVLPDPFGPSRPSTDPVGTEKEMPSTAVKSPNFFTRFSASIAGADGVARAAGAGVVTRKEWTPPVAQSITPQVDEDTICHQSDSARHAATTVPERLAENDPGPARAALGLSTCPASP